MLWIFWLDYVVVEGEVVGACLWLDADGSSLRMMCLDREDEFVTVVGFVCLMFEGSRMRPCIVSRVGSIIMLFSH